MCATTGIYTLCHIFLAGNSGGAIVVLGTMFNQTQSMTNQVFPSSLSSSTVQAVLGGIDADYYVGSSYISDYASHIAGILSLWGAVSAPGAANQDDAKTYFDQNPIAPPPVISFHGKQDPVAPYDQSAINFELDNNYPGGHTYLNTESRCLNGGTFSVDSDPTTVDLIGLGSNQIYPMLKQKSKFAEYYLDCTMQHGLASPGCKGFFGTTFNMSNIPNTNRYIMERAVTFFQTILTSTISLPTKSVFVDCRNDRLGCTVDENDSCEDEDTCREEDGCPQHNP